jgi:putative SOS response-associated peptidase YedK
MCSRYSLTSPPEAVRHLFGYEPPEDFPPRYNIAPTEPILVVRRSESGKREPVLMRWGLIPSWVKDPREFATLINARSETAAEKPSFRGPMRHRRCLVPADGYFEWTGKTGSKTPHLFRLKSRETFAFAGIWDHWLGADGSEIDTAAILTTAANADAAHIHDRMPVLVPEAAFDRWLDCRPGTAVTITDLLAAPPVGLLDSTQVSPKVNNPRNEGPELHEPMRSTLL